MPHLHPLPPTGAETPLQVGDFDRVDAAANPREYVEWMDRQRRGHRDAALDALGLRESDVVLDLGCGTGVDLETMVATTRFAFGLDLSATMATATRDRIPNSAVVVADARHLPLFDESVDACAARAVLIHTPSPQSVVNEIARVLTANGRLVLSEPDHGSHIVSTTVPDVFERIKRHRQTKFRNPLVGRSLTELANAAGLNVVKTWVTPILHTQVASARAAGGPFDRAVADAVADGAITEAEAAAYLTSLAEADERDAFFFSGLAVSVMAVKPGRS